MSRPLAEWLEYIESLSPQHIDMGLERVTRVAERLALQFTAQTKVITIAGTNGKGSTVAALQALGTSLNKSTIAYTSPHLIDFKERLLANGQMLNESEWVDAMENVERARQSTPLTYFEFVTLSALVIASRRCPEWLILEIGLGGRLDAVNIVEPDVAIITSIDFDHEDWLGSTLTDIGREKAGIHRPGKPLLVANASLLDYLPDILKCDDRVEGVDTFAKSLPAELMSICQQLAAQIFPTSFFLALRAADILGVDIRSIDPTALLKHIDLPGRWQQLGAKNVWVDVAHNPQALANLALKIQGQKDIKEWWFLFGQLNDKRFNEALEPLLELPASWFLLSTSGPRGMNIEQIQQRFQLFERSKLKLQLAKNGIAPVLQRYFELSADEQATTGIVGFGSFQVVANMIEYCHKHPQRFRI